MTHIMPSKEALIDAFTRLRAEQFGTDLLKQFSEPTYFPELVTPHPCFLIGGRGTGKTTVLRSLSYESQSRSPKHGAKQPFVGIYHKMNTARVGAFKGSEIPQNEWEKIFSHYINLIFSISILEYLRWNEVCTKRSLRMDALEPLARSFQIAKLNDVSSYISTLREMLVCLEISVNSIGAERTLRLTPLGEPFESLLDSLAATEEFREKTFFFLIDEFENLAGYQQKILNTLIKHARPPFSFKIGVKELGIKERCTLSDTELLVDPADFRRIDITERLQASENFSKFAKNVCLRRLESALAEPPPAPWAIEDYFEDLSSEEEAELLGLGQLMREKGIHDLELRLQNKQAQASFAEMTPLEKYTLWLLEEQDEQRIENYLTSDKFLNWRARFGNYKNSAIFTIKAGKSGIRRYYCGWQTICLLSGGNIRYLLELVHRCATVSMDKKDPPYLISAQAQTLAAQAVGQKNLRELEGLSVYGARIARIVLGIGRIFQVMAEQNIGHTPEVNQFELTARDDSLAATEDAEDLIRESITHLALVRFAGTKLQNSEDVRDYDYSLHPAFSAFFGYTTGKKRKIAITHSDIVGLSNDTSKHVSALLKNQNRALASELPEQMALFKDFYRARD